jgi:hypothetical protein
MPLAAWPQEAKTIEIALAAQAAKLKTLEMPPAARPQSPKHLKCLLRPGRKA